MIKHYFLTELRLLTRHKTRFVLAVLLPVTFYLLFTSILDLPQPIMAKFNQEYMYNMTTFSLMSFCLFSFPFDIIDERTRGWYKRLMRTPLTPAHYIGIKIGKTMCQFALSIVIIFTIAAQFKGVQMAWTQWVSSGVLIWFGASLMLSMGALLAQMNDVQKASGVGNILYLALAVLGGLWFPVSQFPTLIQHVALVTPTYHLKQLSYTISLHQSFPLTSLIVLLVYCIIFLTLALYIRQRSETI
ncbi:ABC transporter permease [Staphylococcus pseudintermedius]|nr:ABC transporter permease [Staphylococcus pseudintermedius]